MSISSTSSSTPSTSTTSTSTESSKPAASTAPVGETSTSPKTSETAKPAESTTSSITGSSGGGGSAEPNLSAEAARFDSTPGELGSGSEASSDPDSSVEFTGVQAEAALDVTGELVTEEDEEAEEVEEAEAALSGNVVGTVSGSAGGSAPGGVAAPDDAMLGVVGELATIRDQLQAPVDRQQEWDLEQQLLVKTAERNALLDQSFSSLEDRLQPSVPINQIFRDSVKDSFGTGTYEAERAVELAQVAVSHPSPEDQEANEVESARLIATIDTPEFQREVAGMSDMEFTTFAEQAIPVLLTTEAGRDFVHNEVIGGFAEKGLEGETDKFFANQFIERLDNPDPVLGIANPSLEFTVGTMIGADQILHPEGAAETLEAVGEGLNLDPSQVEGMGKALTPGSETQDALVAATQTARAVFGPELDAFTARPLPNPDDPGAPAPPADLALLDQFRNADGTPKTGTVFNELDPLDDVGDVPRVVQAEAQETAARDKFLKALENGTDEERLQAQIELNRATTAVTTAKADALEDPEALAALRGPQEESSHRYVIINELPEGTTLEMANEMLDRYNAPTTAALKFGGNDPNATEGNVDMASPMPGTFLVDTPLLNEWGGHVNLYRGETEDGRGWVQNTTIGGEHPLVGHIVRTIVQDRPAADGTPGKFYVVTVGTGEGDMGHGWGPVPEDLRHFANTVVGPPAFNNLDAKMNEALRAEIAGTN